jgi:outer membrane immunogenic protein
MGDYVVKRIIAGVLTILPLFSGVSAFAADLPARTYAKAPVVVDPGVNWTGFYAGLNGGYSWGRATTTLFPNTALATPVRQNVDGGVFGGQIGYNWQVDPKWVVGIEADGQWTGERGRRRATLGSVRTTLPGGDANIVTTTATDSEWSLPWFATFRGRLGILADPSLLFYGTGGLAVGEVKFANQTNLTVQMFGPGANGIVPMGPPFAAVGPALSDSQTRIGWTAGAGIEKKFSKNWSAKLEYLYLDFGTGTHFAGTANAVDVRFYDHVLRAGINYQFTSGPVVARH